MAFQKTRTLRSIKPNPGIKAAYRRDIEALIQEMCDDVVSGLLEAYGKQEKHIVQDAKMRIPENPGRTSVFKLNEQVEAYYQRYRRKWEKYADKLSKRHIGSVNQRVSSSRVNELREMGFVVRLNPSRYSNSRYYSAIVENSQLLRSIPEQYFERVSSAVMRSVSSGMDRAFLQEALVATTGTTMNRAKIIARDQVNKATQALAECTDRDLGLTEGIWIHVPGRKMSRKSHLAMNGKRFSLDKGLWDEEVRQWVKPAQLILCCCEYRPVIPDTWKA